MIETECYKELNVFGPDETRTPDLILDQPPAPENRSCFPFRRRVRFCFILSWLSDQLPVEFFPNFLFRFFLQKKQPGYRTKWEINLGYYLQGYFFSPVVCIGLVAAVNRLDATLWWIASTATMKRERGHAMQPTSTTLYVCSIKFRCPSFFQTHHQSNPSCLTYSLLSPSPKY